MDTKQWFDHRPMTAESQAKHLVLKINKIQILHNGEQKKKIIFQLHFAILVSLCGLFYNAVGNSNHMTLSWICLQRQMKTMVNIRLVSGLGYEPSISKIKMTDASQSVQYLHFTPLKVFKCSVSSVIYCCRLLQYTTQTCSSYTPRHSCVVLVMRAVRRPYMAPTAIPPKLTVKKASTASPYWPPGITSMWQKVTNVL